MKLHSVLINAVADALTDIFQNSKYADKVVEQLLKSNSKWGSRDRAFIAETTYECVRWFRLYAVLSKEITVTASRTLSLRGTKQTGSDFDIPNFIRKDFIDIIGVYLTLKNGESLDYRDFKHLDYLNLKTQLDHISERKIKYSIPDWMDEVSEKELGAEKWAAELEALNKSADVVLRCNTLKIKVLDLKKKLNDINIETGDTPLSMEALILKKRTNVFSTELFKKGLFEVQDAGSQLIAPFLQAESGMRVIDACAGAGGKSLHLATLMQNKGTIISMDTEGRKLEELRKRAQRNGINIIETRTIESDKVINRLHNSADRLLLDVPCSGLGVLRRNPDAKWKLNFEFLNEIRLLQAKILQNYSKVVKIGGKLVYATCSILPSENENQIATFLESNPNWKKLDEKKVSPTENGFDGFYMALLERLS